MVANKYIHKFGLDQNPDSFHSAAVFKALQADFRSILISQGFKILDPKPGEEVTNRKVPLSRYERCVDQIQGRVFNIANAIGLPLETRDAIWKDFEVNVVDKEFEVVKCVIFDDTPKTPVEEPPKPKANAPQKKKAFKKKDKSLSNSMEDQAEHMASKYAGKNFMSNDQIKRSKKF